MALAVFRLVRVFTYAKVGCIISFWTWLWGGSKGAKKARLADVRARRAAAAGNIIAAQRAKDDLAKAAGHKKARPLPTGGGGSPPVYGTTQGTKIGDEPWHQMNSSNVDKVRFHAGSNILQVAFKNKKTNIGSVYEYQGVEPEVFRAFLATHSPGQYVWFVLRRYQYLYRKIGTMAVSPPRPERFDGMPFAVPDAVQEVMKRSGRQPVEGGTYDPSNPAGDIPTAGWPALGSEGARKNKSLRDMFK